VTGSPPSDRPKQVEQAPPSAKKWKIEIEDERGKNERTAEVGIKVPGRSRRLGERIAVVRLRGGSRVPGGLSARGLANVAIGDWSDDFTFVIGNYRYRCPSSAAQFLSPRVFNLHCVDATISGLTLEVQDGDDLFSSMLEAARGGGIAVDPARRPTFEAICAALWN
jgi:hypothetical protein